MSKIDDEDLKALEREARPASDGGAIENAKKMLKMNPKMKPTGMNTAQAAGQLVQAMQQAKAQHVGQTAKPGAAPATASAAPAANTPTLLQALANAKARLAEEKQKLERAAAELTTKLKALEEEKQQLGARICDDFVDDLLRIDPNMVSPKTNFVLKTESEFLASIGFDLDRVVQREKRK